MLRGVVIISLVAFVAIDGLPNHESDNGRYDSSFQANGRQRQQSRAYDEEHISSLDVDGGRMVQTQAGSQWARNSEAESGFDVNQSVKEEFSNDGGVLRHSNSVSESHDESQSSQDSSRQTSYYAATSNVGDGHQGPINHGYRPYSPGIPQPVPPIVRPLPIRQPGLTHLPNHVHHDTNLRNANEYYQDNHGHGHYGHPSDRNGNYGHNGWYVTPNGWFRRYIPQSGIHPHRHYGYQPGYQGIPNDHYNKFHKIGNPALDARNNDKTKVKYVPNGHQGSPGHTKPSLDEVLNALGYNPNKDKHDAPNKINHGMAPDINNKENDGIKVNFVNGSDETNTAKDVPVDGQGNIPEIKTPEHPTGGLDHVLSAIDYARTPKKPSNYEAETIQYVPAIVSTEYLNRPVNYDAIGIEVPEPGILIPEESEEYVPTYPVRYIPVAENIQEYVIPNQRVRYYENPVSYVGSPVVLPEETGYTNERFAPDNGFVKPYTGQFHPEPTFVPEVSYSPIDDDSSKTKNSDVNEDGKLVNGDDIIIDRRFITKESTETSQETNKRSKQTSSTTIIRKNVGVRPLEDDDNDDTDDVIIKTPVPINKPSEGTINNDKEPKTPTPKVPRKIPIQKHIYPPRDVIHKNTDAEPIHIEPTYVPEVSYSPTEDKSPEKKSPTVIKKIGKKNADVTPLEEDDDILAKKPVPVTKPGEGINNNDKEPKTPKPNDKVNNKMKKPPVSRRIPIYPPRNVIPKKTDATPFVIGKITDEPDTPGADNTVVKSEHDVINQNSDVPYVVERKPGHNDAKPKTTDSTNKPTHIEPTYVPEVPYSPTEDNSPRKKNPTVVKMTGKNNADVRPLEYDDNDDILAKKPVPVTKPSEGTNNNDKQPKTPTPNDKIKKPPVPRKIPIQKNIYPPRDVIHKKTDTVPFVIGKITDEPDTPGADKTVVRSEHDVINQNSDVPYVVERKPVNDGAKPIHIEPTYAPEFSYSPTEDNSPNQKSPTAVEKTGPNNADVTPLEDDDDDILAKKPVPVTKPSEGTKNNDKEPKTPTTKVPRKIPIQKHVYPPRDVIHKKIDAAPFVIGKITDEPETPGADKTVVRSEHDVINQNSDVPYVVERKPVIDGNKPQTIDDTKKPTHIEPTYVPEVSYSPTEDKSPEKKNPTVVKKNADVTPLEDDDDIPVKKPVPVNKPSEGTNNNDKEPITPTPENKIKKPPVPRKIPIYPPRDVIHKKTDAAPFVIGKITDEPDQPGADKTVVRSEHDIINQNSDVPYVVERKPGHNDVKPKTTDGTNKPTHIEPTYVPEVPYNPTEDKSPEKKSANNDAKPKTTDDTNKPTGTKPTPVKNTNIDDKGTPENKEAYTVRTPSGVILHVHEIPVDEDAAPKPKDIIYGNKDNIVKKKPITKPYIYTSKKEKIVHGYKPDHEIKDATTAKDEKANPTTAKPVPQIGKPIPRMPKGPDGYIDKTRQPKKLGDDVTPIEDINQRPKSKEPVTPTAPIKKENETPDKTVKKPKPNNDSDSDSQDSNEDDDYYKIIKSFRTINTEEEESSSSHNSRTETRVQRILRHKSHKPGDKVDLNDDDDTVKDRPVNHEQTTKKPRKKFPFKVVGESNDDSNESDDEEDYLDNDKKSPATEKPDKKQPIKPVTDNNKNNPKPNDKSTDKNAITTEKSITSTTTKKPDATEEPSVKKIDKVHDKKPIKGINTPNEEKPKDASPIPDIKEIKDEKKPNIIRRKPIKDTKPKTDKDVNDDEEFVSKTKVIEESEDSAYNNKQHKSITETEEIIKRGQKKPVKKPNQSEPESTNNGDEETPVSTTDKTPNATPSGKTTDGNNKPVTKKPGNEKKPDSGNNDTNKKPKNKTPIVDKKPDTKNPKDEKQVNKPEENKTDKPITTTDDKAPKNEPTKENKPAKSGTTEKPTTKDNNTDKKPNASPDTDKTSTTEKDNKPDSPTKKPKTVDTKNKTPDTTKPKEKGGKAPLPIIKGDIPIRKMPVRPDIIRPSVTPIDDDESGSVECESWEDWEDEDIKEENEKETGDKMKKPVNKNNEEENAAPDSKNASPKPNSSTTTEKSEEKNDDLNKNKKTSTESNKGPSTTETPKDKQPKKPVNENPDTSKSNKEKKPSSDDSKNRVVDNNESNKPKTATEANIPTATATTPATVSTEKSTNTEKPKRATDCDYFGNVDCEDYDDDDLDSKTKVNATESPEYDADDEIIEDDDVDSNENDDVTEDSEESVSDEDISTEDADQVDGKKPNVEEKPNSENKPDDKPTTTTIKPDAVTTEKSKKPSGSSENKDKPAENKKPVDDVKTPSNNNGKPTASTEKPTGNNKITEDKTKPSENNKQPKNNDDTPADNGKKPTKDNEELNKNDKNTSNKNTKPAGSTEKPTGDKNPTEDKKKPSESNEKPRDSDKSTGNKKPTKDDNKPSQNNDKPNENTKKPNENNDKPVDSNEKPENQKPVDNSKKPSEDNQKPNENVKKPNENGDKPADSGEKPENQKPVDNSKKPSEDNQKPNENTKKPNENSVKPADSTEKPGNQKPVDNSKKPSEDNQNNNKPTDSTEKQKPLEDNKKPNQNKTSTEKPKVDNTKEPSTEVPDDGSKEDKASQEDINSDEIDDESSEEDVAETKKPGKDEKTDKEDTIGTDSDNMKTTTEKKPDNGEKTDKPKPKTNDCEYFGDVDCEDYNDDDIENVTDKQDDVTKPKEPKKKPEPNNKDKDANKPTINANEPEPNNTNNDANKPVNQQPGSKKPDNKKPDTSNEGKDRTDINEKPSATPDNKPTTQKPKSIFVNCQHFGSVDCKDNPDDDQHNPDNAEDKKPDNNTGIEKPKPDTETVDKKKPEDEKPGIFNPGFYNKDNADTNKDIDEKTKPEENKEPDTKKPKADTGKSNDKKPEALDKDAKGTDKPDGKPNTETEKSPKPNSNNDNKKGNTEKPDKGTEKKQVNENPEKDGNKDNKPNTEDGGKDKPENKEKKPVEQNPNGNETTDKNNKPKPNENDKKPNNQNTGKIPNHGKKPVPNSTPNGEKPIDTNTDKKPVSENADKKPDTKNTSKKPESENTDKNPDTKKDGKKPKDNKTDNTKPTAKDQKPDSKTTGNDKKPDNENPKKDNGDSNKKPAEKPKNGNAAPDSGKPDGKPTETNKTPVTKKPDSKTTDKDANNKPTTKNDKPVTKTTTPDQPKDGKTTDNDKNKKPKDNKTKDEGKPSTNGKKPIVDNKDNTDTIKAGKDKVLDTNNQSQEKEVTIKRKVVNSMDEVLKYKDREGFTFKACDETETSEESSSTNHNKEVKLTKFIRTKKHLHKRPKTDDERPVKDKRPTKIPIYRRKLAKIIVRILTRSKNVKATLNNDNTITGNNGNTDKIQQIWLTEGDRIILRRSVEDIQEKELGCLEKLFESDGTVPLDDDIVSDADADDDDDGKEVSVDREDTVDRAPLEDIPDDDDSDGIVPLEENLSSNDDQEGDGSKSNSKGREDKSSDSGSRKASPVKQSIAQRKLMVSRQ